MAGVTAAVRIPGLFFVSFLLAGWRGRQAPVLRRRVKQGSELIEASACCLLVEQFMVAPSS